MLSTAVYRCIDDVLDDLTAETDSAIGSNASIWSSEPETDQSDSDDDWEFDNTSRSNKDHDYSRQSHTLRV